MATTTYLGTLQYDSGGGTFVDIGELIEFDPPQRLVDAIKDSHLASTGATHTFQAGFIEPGEIVFTINMKKADFNTLNTHLTGRANRDYRVRYNDSITAGNGSKLQGNGLLTELGDEKISRDSTNPIQTKGKIKASGVWTFTQGT